MVIDHELVQDLLVGLFQIHVLLPDIANLVQLDGLAPIIEGARDVDVVGLWMGPEWKISDLLGLERVVAQGLRSERMDLPFEEKATHTANRLMCAREVAGTVG